MYKGGPKRSTFVLMYWDGPNVSRKDYDGPIKMAYSHQPGEKKRKKKKESGCTM
jgi:hypothetical protein